MSNDRRDRTSASVFWREHQDASFAGTGLRDRKKPGPENFPAIVCGI
ncbi:MAG: hypothetical protein N3A38_10800 [Planctomycetota bacterium]|nr:hypothetical protein [Planctomycetota bacterium]